MKPTHIVFALGIMLCTACQNQKNSQAVDSITTDSIATDSIPGNYGASLDQTGIVSPAEMLMTVEKEGDFEGKITGEIKEVCTKKGCWITMDLPNGETMRVTFKDYGFFVPTTSKGYPVILEGIAVLTETDVETLRHYAEDEGKSKEEVEKITEPKREITFEAVAVVIQDKA